MKTTGALALHDVGVEVGAEFGQLLAQLLNFFAFIRRKVQTGAAIIAHCFVEQLFVFARKLGIRVGERLERFVNILAIIDADRPVLKRFYRVLGSVAHFRIGVRLFNDRRPVRGSPAC